MIIQSLRACLFLLPVLVSAWPQPAVAQAVSYTLTEVSPGSFSPAYGNSNNGNVVGYTGPTYGNEGYIWRDNSLTVITPPAGFAFPISGGSAYLYFNPQLVRVNDSAVVAGVGRDLTQPTFDLPAIWSAGGGLQLLGGFDESFTTQGAAISINNKNEVVGWAYGGGYNAFGPFIWTANTGVQRLSGYPSGNRNGIATDINESSEVVGQCTGCGSDISKPYAFHWSDATGLTVIPLLHGDSSQAMAFAINDNHQVVGIEGDATNATNEVFLWSPGGAVISLGNPDGGYIESVDINDQGLIVVTTVNVGRHSYLYRGGAWTNLNDLPGVSGSGFVIESVRSINDAGQMVGDGARDGGRGSYGFVLTPQTVQLTLSKSVVPGCLSVSAKVSLEAPAPSGGITVQLGDDLPSTVVPATVKIPEGALSKSFSIKTVSVMSQESGTVSATLAGVASTKSLTVRPIGLTSVSLTPATQVGGLSVAGKVTLECNAGPGPIDVLLASGNSAIAYPVAPTITVPQGLKTADFTVATNSVLSKTSTTISGTSNGTAKSKTLSVTPAATVSPTSIKFGSVAIGATSASQTVTLNNKGAVPFLVNSIGLTGAAASWFVLQSNTCPAGLPAGDSCTMTVQFKPVSAATKSAKLTIATSATSTPLNVTLSGTGI